jgi:selenocysteine lyase/cysteine desulfurase
MQNVTFEWLRTQIVGIDSLIETPFGSRPLVYCDYTASGRSLWFVEKYLLGVQRFYANTHTEDDITGRSMTRLLHDAEMCIKKAVNAGPGGRLISVGTGATGAIDRYQQILGIAIAPATRAARREHMAEYFGNDAVQAFSEFERRRQPVVFVGPYEHHSNEVSWRQGIATVVEVQLAANGEIDLAHLELLLKDPAYIGRRRIGSFSAASNVTGVRSPVHAIARLLHRHGALACFDFAASGPYVAIDMNPPADPDGGDPALDAIFISPHKFVGGPGSTGLLVFNERVYPRELPPTVCGGGTVDYVNPEDQDFIADIEARERAGTPGVLQTLKAALVFAIKETVTTEKIEAKEALLLKLAFDSWKLNESIEILGNPDASKRIGIVSFNIRTPSGRYLHPKFVTALLNDLFGIQSRAGCSCAGPYGHRLLDIGSDISNQYREFVRKGFQGIKPGWCRLGFHFTMDEIDAQYVIEAVNFVSTHGHRFLPLYDFDVRTGQWTHRGFKQTSESFSLHAALACSLYEDTAIPEGVRRVRYREYLRAALGIVESLPADLVNPALSMEVDFGALQYFDR